MSDFEILPSLAYEGFQPWPEKLKGWHGTDPIFMELINETQPKLIIEVGTWLGQSAINMANCLKALEIDAKIICVDTWLGAVEFIDKPRGSDWDLMPLNGYPQVYYQFLSNVMHWGHEDIIIPFPQTSINAARYFQSKGIQADLIYIDGSHEFEDVEADIRFYWPLLSQEGIMFGDDFNSSYWPGVVEGVQSAFDRLDYDDAIEEQNEFWLVRKKWYEE